MGHMSKEYGKDYYKNITEHFVDYPNPYFSQAKLVKTIPPSLLKKCHRISKELSLMILSIKARIFKTPSSEC